MLEIHDSIALKSRKNLSLAITKVRERERDAKRTKLSLQFCAAVIHVHFLSRIKGLSNVTIGFRSEEINS